MQDTYILVTKGDESVDLRIFDDLEWLLGHVEPPEALAGAYEIFDSVGRKARLNANRDQWEVTVVGWEDGNEDDLRRHAHKALDPDLSAKLVGLDLPSFVAALRERGPLFQRPDPLRPRILRWFRRLD